VSLDPPKVLLDRSFLIAVTDPEHPCHDECVGRYRALVDGFEREQLLLVAVSTHLRDIERGPEPPLVERVTWLLHRRHRGVFAPVEPLYVGLQHRRAAGTTNVDDRAVALTLVMCHRHKVRRIAAATDAYNAFDIEQVHPVGD
jgi:hypothetical protein